MRQQIIKRLENSLNCKKLEVIDESHLHAGHNSDAAKGETHFRIKINSVDLENLSTLKKHQKIYKILTEEIKQIHAIAIEAK